MSLKEVVDAATDFFQDSEVPSPRLNAELLLMFVLGCDRSYLFAHPEQLLKPEEDARYREVVRERAGGCPTQYITGHQEFWGMDLIVSPAVLIPRPETEHIVETAMELAKSKLVERRASPPACPERSRRVRIVDVGTGSGAIALALAKELPTAEIHATDISPEALEVARANAARHELTARIEFHQADLLDGFPPASFDIVVSNPPYVGESEEDSVQLEVRKFEPRNAAFAGPTGLEVIERLIPQAQTVLRPGGWLVFEISGTIAEAVRRRLAGWTDVGLTSDLQGIARVAAARKPSSS